jgi:hypothetical protein
MAHLFDIRPLPVFAKAGIAVLLLLTSGLASGIAAPQTREDAEAAKRALDPQIYQATTDALLAQREAETRKAIAEAERAELLARLPPSTSRPLPGAADTRQFGAAGLVKAFDLAQQLATEVCAALPADSKAVIYEAAAAQGVVAARTVQDSIARLSDDLSRQNKELQVIIDKHTPPSSKVQTISLAALTVVPATVKAFADMTSLFKTDVSAAGIAYGDGARSLFATALAHACPARVAGLGTGYLGELDAAQYDKLLARVRTLANQRGEYANRIAVVQRLADEAKGEQKKALAAVAASAGALLKTIDGFVESLKAGEASDRSPLFNAARYLGYAGRTTGSLVLEFDLRLEGMTIVKDNMFTGQHLRLSGVAFLWYRVYEPNGTLLLAKAVRKITAPVEVDLRGSDAGGEFWNQPGR